MLVDGISDTELARIFEQLHRGGEADLQTKDGRMVHIEVDKVDPNSVQDHDWV